MPAVLSPSTKRSLGLIALSATRSISRTLPRLPSPGFSSAEHRLTPSLEFFIECPAVFRDNFRSSPEILVRQPPLSTTSSFVASSSAFLDHTLRHFRFTIIRLPSAPCLGFVGFRLFSSGHELPSCLRYQLPFLGSSRLPCRFRNSPSNFRALPRLRRFITSAISCRKTSRHSFSPVADSTIRTRTP